MIEADWTVDTFAAKCGAPAHTTAREWLNGNVLPDAHYLLGIAIALGVTVDWLLTGEGPEYKGATRTTADLKRDLALAITARAAGTADLSPAMLAHLIDGADLLGHLVRLVSVDAASIAGYLAEYQRVSGAIADLPRGVSERTRNELRRAFGRLRPPGTGLLAWKPTLGVLVGTLLSDRTRRLPRKRTKNARANTSADFGDLGFRPTPIR
jgi:transcriptional regulator with XRE-family HTH domain